MNTKEYNTKLLMKIATYMAKGGMVDISYREIEEIMEDLEKEEENK